MQTSPELDKIAPALVKARKAMPAVVKDATNPQFGSRYASLGAIMDAAIPVLNAHGMTVVQGGGPASDDAASEVVTRILHESGQWIEASVRMPLAKANPQGAGSSITYGKRFGLAAVLGLVADDDDDGHAASTTKPEPKAESRRSDPPPTPSPSGEPACPSCGGKMWDNREGKKNPKAPDFKCRDKQCDGVIWPRKKVAAGGPGAPGSFEEFPESLRNDDGPEWES